jgi:hypothetical protein
MRDIFLCFEKTCQTGAIQKHGEGEKRRLVFLQNEREEASVWTIDYVSLIIFVAAYFFTRIRSVPLRVRDAVFGLALGGIGAYRMVAGAEGANLAIALAACVIGTFYLVKALRGGRR